MSLDESAWIGRPVTLRVQGLPKAQEHPSCALTVPSWLMRRSGFKIGDKFVPSFEDGKVIYTKET